MAVAVNNETSTSTIEKLVAERDIAAKDAVTRVCDVQAEAVYVRRRRVLKRAAHTKLPGMACQVKVDVDERSSPALERGSTAAAKSTRRGEVLQ